MEIELDVSFFESALDQRTTPSFSPESPYRTQLVVAGSELPLAVEFIQLANESKSSSSLRINGRTLSADVDYSSLSKGIEFFVSEGGRMIGRGKICDIGI